MDIYLPARPPFSFQAVVHSHGWVQLAPFRQDEAQQRLTYVDRLSTGRVAAYTLTEADSGARLHVTAHLNAAEQAEAARKVSWMLGLEQDFSEFYAMASGEPELAHVVGRAQGRVLRSPTVFEDVIKTILTTNTLWGATIRMTDNLVRLYGEPLTAEPDRHAFPTPERLAALDEATLRSEARLGYRAPYILALAQEAAAGRVDLEALKTSDLPTPELRKRLMALKGVGGYAAANLLNILGRYDYLPVDSWALKMVSQEWHQGAPIGPAEVEAAFARWGKWKGLAYWFWQWKN
jgi:3-methyladenine DNA glycosylase/8-oxoguanine DNA glycosylase